MEDLEQLRKILLGREREELDDLRQQLESVPADSEALAKMLPAALRSSHSTDPKLAQALQQPVSECLKESAKTDPQPLVDALFPVIGPAIRKAIAESLREFNQTINQAIEHSVSPKGIGWRLESLRTGVPFSEIVMRNTLRYRVERVFLVHRDSGLLVEHVAADDAGGMDSDAVSGMLSAIDSFVRDSFMQGEQGGDLDSVDIGEYTLWIVHGPHAALACAIRGVAPAEMRQRVKVVLEEIHAEYGQALDGFSGDRVALVGVENYLNRCLFKEEGADQSATRTADAEEGNGSGSRKLFGWFLLGAGLLALALTFLVGRWTAGQVETLRQTLDASPGIVVTQVEKSDGVWLFRGLRDPLAVQPLDVEQSVIGPRPQGVLSKLSPRFGYDLRPFYSLEPEMIALREPPPAPVVTPPVDRLAQLTDALAPPAEVRMSLEGSRLVLEGRSSHAWLAETEKRLATYNELEPNPAPLTIRLRGFSVSEFTEAKNLTAALGAQQVYFDQGTDIRGTPMSTLERSASLATRLIKLAKTLDAQFEITLLGFTDAVGDDRINSSLKLARAEVLRDELVARGVPAARIIIGTGKSAPDGSTDPEWRRVDVTAAFGTPALLKRLR